MSPATARPRRFPGGWPGCSSGPRLPTRSPTATGRWGSRPTTPRGRRCRPGDSQAVPSGRRPGGVPRRTASGGTFDQVPRGENRGVEHRALHSSMIRSQLTSRLFLSFICSFASICQVSWGAVARSAAAFRRRPAGAGARSVRTNHRRSVRSVGTGCCGVSTSNWTRIHPAPQVGARDGVPGRPARRRAGRCRQSGCGSAAGCQPSRRDGTSGSGGRPWNSGHRAMRRSGAPVAPAARAGRWSHGPVQGEGVA